MENRKTVGERLLERASARERTSSRLTRHDSRFAERFTRYGRTDSISRIGNFFAPQSRVAFSEHGEHGPELLSSAPYWARLQRLGNARLRRDQRLAALAERAQGRAKLSAITRLPDARPKSLPFLGLPSIIADQFEVLAPLPAPVDPETLAALAEFQGQGQFAGHTITPNVSHLEAREFVSAKVIRESGKRPLQRIQDRAPAPKRAVAAARQAISRRVAQLSSPDSEVPTPRGKTRSDRPVAASDIAGRKMSGSTVSPEVTPSRRVNRTLRRSMKGRSTPLRVASVDYEAALPDDFLAPTRHAQGRLNTARSGGKRGLRTALSRTPLMAALEPRQAAESGLFTNDARPVRPSGQTSQRVGSTTARRMAHRAVDTQTPMLSTSPVRRPALMAPSAVTLESATVAPAYSDADETPRQSVPAAPMVRAMERSSARPTQLSERPLTERKPVANRPVRTRSGQFAPEATVLVPGVDPVTVTEDAQPEQAARIATRASASARAVERMEQSEATDERRSVPAAHRPNRIARTRRGAFAPESTVLAPESAVAPAGQETPTASLAAKVGSAATTTDADSKRGPRRQSAATAAVERADARQSRASSTSPSQTPRLKDVSGRIDAEPATVSAPKVRRTRGVPQLEDSAVLTPTLRPEEELSQGQHAAERLQRVPVVGQSTTKVVERMTERVTAQAAMPAQVAQRRVAPRLFKSPLSHISVKRSAKGGRPGGSVGPARERVVLRAATGDVLSESTSERAAQRAGQERVETAWAHAGRPLDWTDARIEVIQVPLMMGAATNEREAPRTERTVAGEYIPVRTGQTRTSAARPSVDGVTLARPDVAGSMDPVEEQQGAMARPMGAVPGQASAPVAASTPVDGTPARQRTGAWRSGFDATMGRVQSGAVHNDLPVWAQRSTGRPRITGADDLVQQLATASAPEDIVQVLMDSGDAARRATSSLPQPVIQVIQQIKTEAVRAEGEVRREEHQERAALSTETVRARASRREGARSTTRVARGMTGLNPRGSASAASAPAMNKVTQLAKRLQELIAMAESQNRSGARQQVRMAEDSNAAKAEGQSAPTSAETGRDASADIDTLTREVIEQVTRELEMRRERRQEDPDGRSIWW